MSLMPKQFGLVEPVADLATGGAIALAVATNVEQLRAVVVSQTTAGQTITLPDPVDTSVVFSLSVFNAGTADFSMYGVTVSVGGKAVFGWNGAAWAADVAPTSLGQITEDLVPTGANTVPNLSSTPRPGTAQMFYVNGHRESAGISSDAAGAITVVPATLGYNLDATDVVTVDYFAA